MPLIPDAIDSETFLPRPLRVLMVSAELAPFARAGGLGDMMQGLTRALGSMGVELVVVTPKYASTFLSGVSKVPEWARPLWVTVGDDVKRVFVHEVQTLEGVRVLLLDHPPLYDRPYIYGSTELDYPDNDQRFALLGAAALETAQTLWGQPPDVLHAQDWPSAPALVYARLNGSTAWKQTPSVFTFHNLAFQGVFDPSHAPLLGFPEGALHEDGLLKDGKLNFMMAGLSYADRITTVSPSYAREALTPQFSMGFERALRTHAGHLTGITNGIDLDTWDPSRDRHIAARYDAHDILGKQACRTSLAAELGLSIDNDMPLVGMVSRLTPQKGMDIVVEHLPRLLDRGFRFVIVATGSGELRKRLETMSVTYRGRLAFRAAFGDPLARRVYAGSDVFLMPSRLEPCGLGQQYAMRYGTPPVASAVGGLVDTITPIAPDTAEGTGILFDPTSAQALPEALEHAARLFHDKALWRSIVHNCMVRDASWDTSARKLFALYRDLAGAPPRPSLPPPTPVSVPQKSPPQSNQ